MNHILIVDDKEENLYLLRALLEGHGCAVDEARHGAEALVKARLHPPQLIISDLLMPVMDGYTLLRHWKADEKLNAIPFVVYTATYTEPQDERLALDLGADAFILKPAEPAPFMARIREILEKQKHDELAPAHALSGDVKVLLKEYSEVLIHKLEEKALQLEQTNRALEQDIAARKQTEQFLQRQARLLDQSFDAVFAWELDGPIVYWSLGAERLYGIAPADAVGRNSHELLHTVFPESLQHCKDALVRTDHWEGELNQLARDGRRLVVESRMTLVREDDSTLVLEATCDITERRRAEAALQKSVQSYSTLVKNIAGAVYWCRNDQDWTVDFISDGCFEITGYRSEEFLGNKVTSLGAIMHPEDAELVWEKCQANFAARKACSNEYRIIHRSGEIRWVWDQTQCIYSDSGELMYIEGLITDITARKQMEDALKLFRTLVDQSNDAIEVLDPETGRFLDVNEKGCLDLGYSREEFLALSVFDIDPMVDKSVFTRSVEELRKSGALMWEGIHRRKDGSTFPVEVNLKYVQLDRDYMIAVVRDITERKQAEEALRGSEARLRLALDAARMGTFDWDIVRGKIVWSRGHKILFGFAPGEFGGTYEAFEQRVHPEDLPGINAGVARCIATREPFSREFRVVWPDGSEHWIAGNGEFEFTDTGQAVRMRGVVMEVTERKRSEMELLESASQLRALTNRLQSIREEERTAIAREIHDVLAQELTRLKIDVAWLNKRLMGPVDQHTRLTMIDKLKDMTVQSDAAIHTVQKIATELRPIILDSLGLLAAIEWQGEDFEKRSGIRCRVTVPSEELLINHDQATAFFRILQESLTNVLRHAQATQVNVVLTAEDEHLLLTIGDNGCGMPQEKLHDPHSIGLTGMRERALAFGGTVKFTGIPGAGTKVMVRMPLLYPAELE